jgi:uncharacterized repeat protein (TIGR03806 family)
MKSVMAGSCGSWLFNATIRSLLLLGTFSFLSLSALAGALQRVPNTTLAMPSAPPTFPGYTLTNAFGMNFLDAVEIVTPPGETNRVFVVERGGNIVVITNLAAPTRTIFLNATSKVTYDNNEGGLLSLAFHPNYASNGYFYVWYYGPDSTTAGTGAHDVLARYQVSPTNANFADPATEVRFLRQFDQAGNHNGGDLHFGADGYLYMSLGDEGDQYDQHTYQTPTNNSQQIDRDFFSGMLRIDVDKKPGNLTPNPHPAVTTNYLVPADNPWVGATTLNGTNINTNNLHTEFWAIGFRNPFRWNFDSDTGLLYLGDVGQDLYEEVNIVVKGGNYGWNFRDGFTTGFRPAPSNFTSINPILVYNHGLATNQGDAIIGGVVYRGSQLSQLYGCYIFGDNVSSNIWSLKYDGTNVSYWQRIAGAVGVSSFGVDPRNGDILLTARGTESSNATNQPILRLIYSGSQSGAPIPPTLVATGAFSNLTTLTPNAGIVPYDINVPFWSDNAIKTRWFSVPNTNLTVVFSATNNYSFPTGTVWIKHFDLQTNDSPPSSTRVETRLLVRNSNGVYGVTYRWGGSTTNATLVPEGGMDENFTITQGGIPHIQTWHFPSWSECQACHSAVGGLGLGFNTAQLNKDFNYSGNVTNQIQALSDAGYFSAPVAGLHTLPALASATNTAASLEYRVRSYLAANCSQCHQPGGAALALWDARFKTPGPQAGIINGPLLNNFGDTNNRVVAPGSLGNSVLFSRVASLDGNHMPPLDTTVLNTQAVQLLSNWITTDLLSYQSYATWQMANFGNTNAPNTQPTADYDNDRALNYLEYLTGTDPTNPNSFWSINISASGVVSIAYPQVANRGFEVQVNTSLSNPNGWTPLDVTGNEPFFSSSNRTATVFDALGASPKYYRVRVFEP